MQALVNIVIDNVASIRRTNVFSTLASSIKAIEIRASIERSRGRSGGSKGEKKKKRKKKKRKKKKKEEETVAFTVL